MDTIFKNRRGLEYKIVEFDHRTDKQNYYRVRFLVSGSEKVASMSDIKRGKVKDVLEHSVAGIGYYGNDDVKVNSTSRAYSVWHNMILRCYDPTSIEYPRYGAKGVRVCDRWHCFTKFVLDLSSISGYDEKKFLDGEIFLDKDLKQLGKNCRIYSPDTCTFLSALDNIRLCNKNLRSIIATSPEGVSEEWPSVRAFCEAHSYIKPNNIYQVLCGYSKRTHGWTFMYCNDYRKPGKTE